MTSSTPKEASVDAEELGRLLVIEQNRLLYRHAGIALVASIVNALFLAYLFRTHVDSMVLAVWEASILAMVIGRLELRRRYFASGRDTERAQRWLRRAVISTTASAAVWGAAGIVLFVPNQPIWQFALCLVVAGMSAGATVGVACHLPAFYAYLGLALGPLIVRVAIAAESEVHVFVVLMLVLFAVSLVVLARSLNRSFVEAHRLEFANAALARRLQIAAHARENAESRLREIQQLETMGRLTGGVAHDFNNLLTVITSNLELIRARLELDDTMERRIGRALEAAERGAQLTRSLLAFSRQQALRPEGVDLDTLIEDMHDTMEGLVGGQIKVIRNLSSTPCIAHIDPTQLQAAIINLVVNARDAMPRGGTLTFETDRVDLPNAPAGDEAGSTPEYVLLRVRDTGVGMEDAVAEHAFEPFFTTKEVGHGSGLGLSMVHGFVHQSKGVVQLMSKPGRGTTVELHLPCHEGKVVEAAADARIRDSA